MPSVRQSSLAPQLAHGRRKPRRGCITAAILPLLLLSAAILAHRGHSFGSPFHSVPLEEAFQLANAEFKLVFVYVTKPNHQASRYLERPTWHDWRTIDLLIRETVAVKLDGRRNAAELDRYAISDLPAILLLDSAGNERQRLPGELSANKLMEKLAAALSGADSVARVRQAVETGGPNDPLARERLAETLARHGAHAEALQEYLWCLDVGLRTNVPYASARRRLLLKGFVALSDSYPAARETLEQRRTALEKTLRHERDDPNLARDLAELNRCLNDERRTLILFDQLQPRSRARYILFEHVLEQLIEQRRYDEVLALVDPRQVFMQDARLARARADLFSEGENASRERGTRAFAVARGAGFLEALAACGRVEEARALVDQILAFQDAPQTRTLLQHHARRAGSHELVEYIVSMPVTSQRTRRP
ncbi:MAG: hypothetical protein KKB50_07180 [Planctomycetes bacterium]|nr:hypothetical protein [Planctomycetota bacterium]